MNVIVTSIPSDRAIRDALIREVKTGFQLAKELTRKDEIVAAAEAKALRGHKPIGKDVNMRCVAVYPQDEYLRLVNKYGHKEVSSKGFIRYFQKKFPELSPNKL